MGELTLTMVSEEIEHVAKVVEGFNFPSSYMAKAMLAGACRMSARAVCQGNSIAMRWVMGELLDSLREAVSDAQGDLISAVENEIDEITRQLSVAEALHDHYRAEFGDKALFYRVHEPEYYLSQGASNL